MLRVSVTRRTERDFCRSLSCALSSEKLTRRSQTGLKHPSNKRFWCRTCLVVLATHTLTGREQSPGRPRDLLPRSFVSHRLNFFVAHAAPQWVFRCYSMKEMWRASSGDATFGCA